MKLLIIDPDITLASPAMKGVIRSFPEMRAAGFEIEVWCWRCDDGIEPDRIVRLPCFGARLLGPLQALAFSIIASITAFWRFTVRHEPRADVIYSIVPYLSRCDVAHAHFSPWDWERRMKLLGSRTFKEWLERLANLIMRFWTNRFLRSTKASIILVPSDAVAADFKAAAPQANISVLPNSFDPSRFNLESRSRYRDAKRKKLSYSESDRVFAFVSTGHYRRKGFFLAVRAVEQLHASQPSARLLVVGGKPSAIERLMKRLDSDHPGWQSWLHFAGSVSEPERYFAAADAFLFPSYSEAFALVEVEAAACGLPLFLTRHHGSEMVLEDGINGRFIEFDPDHITTVLADFVSGQWQPQRVSLKRALDGPAYAKALVETLKCGASFQLAHQTPASGNLEDCPTI